eukprot:UN15564
MWISSLLHKANDVLVVQCEENLSLREQRQLAKFESKLVPKKVLNAYC